MLTDVSCLPSTSLRIVSNQQALHDEVVRRRTGTPVNVADVYYSSMPLPMEQAACSLAATGMEAFNTEKEIAKFMKESFDLHYGKAWQCICGKHFGSYVTFEPDNFIYFRLGATAFMLFRTIEIKAKEVVAEEVDS